MEDYIIIFFRIITIMTLLLFVTIYIMGKRPIGELPVFDFLVIITMGAVVGADIADPEIEHLPTAFAIIILGVFQYIVSKKVLKHRKFARLVTFEPTLVMEKGRFLVKNLRGIKYSVDEILMMLRENGIFDFKEVRYALIESNGKLTVLKNADVDYIRPRDMNIPVKELQVPAIVVLEGEIDRKSLERVGLTEEKIVSLLNAQGYSKLSDIFVATYTEAAGIYVSPYGAKESSINIEH